MKNKIIATLVAFGLVGSASAIDINENLSINGFIDTSYQHNEGATTTQELGLDEIELNFLFNVGGASGAIHIDDGTSPSDAGAGIELEQAFIGYSLENGVSFTLGKYGSELGFEREDPGGLYTFSRAYGGFAVGEANPFNMGDVDSNVYEGIRLGYSSDIFGLGISLQNDAKGLPDSDDNIENNELDLEVSFAYTGIENLNIGGGYRFENNGNSNAEVDALNIHVTTVMGKFLLGAEYIELDNGGGDDLDGWLVIADYDVSDKLGVALRISSNELDGNRDYEKVTIAPNYALSDSLGVILEYSDVENASADANELALELTFTF